MTREEPDAEERHHRRLRRRVLAGVVLVALLGAAVGTFAYLWSRSDARPVSLDEARRRFLEERVGRGSAAGPFTPPEGVYAYTGSGSEHLSSPPKSQSEGPEMPGTVRHGADGCWSFRLDYSTNHWREWRFCADADGLRQHGSTVFQRWDFVVSSVDNTTVMRCQPPAVVLEADMAPGDEWESTCRGESTAISGETVSTGTHRFVGRETLRVGGRAVETMRFRDDRVVSGAQTGTETFDLWLADDGLVVQGRQRIVVDSDSPIGQVTYTQEGEFRLVSAPARAPAEGP